MKVNAPVDAGVADIVAALNQVQGLETLQSCQGDAGKQDGYVYFSFGDWQQVGSLVFDRIGPAVHRHADDEARIVLEASSSEFPVAKLSFRAEAAEMVATALKEALTYERP